MVAMKMDRVVVHAEVDQADADSFPCRTMTGVLAGPDFPLKVSQLNSIFMELER